jgi:hypothetical protein
MSAHPKSIRGKSAGAGVYGDGLSERLLAGEPS